MVLSSGNLQHSQPMQIANCVNLFPSCHTQPYEAWEAASEMHERRNLHARIRRTQTLCDFRLHYVQYIWMKVLARPHNCTQMRLVLAGRKQPLVDTWAESRLSLSLCSKYTYICIGRKTHKMLPSKHWRQSSHYALAAGWLAGAFAATFSPLKLKRCFGRVGQKIQKTLASRESNLEISAKASSVRQNNTLARSSACESAFFVLKLAFHRWQGEAHQHTCSSQTNCCVFRALTRFNTQALLLAECLGESKKKHWLSPALI